MLKSNLMIVSNFEGQDSGKGPTSPNLGASLSKALIEGHKDCKTSHMLKNWENRQGQAGQTDKM